MPPALKNEEFLKKARDRFKFCLEDWKDIREQHDIDMRFLAGDSWDPTEKNARKEKHIPMVHFDELTQFINQLINDVRQNKRAVKVLPKGEGATDKTADTRGDWIRAVEYQSNAQTAYTTAFEGECGGSYGFIKLETYYENSKSFNLSARIVPIPNANTIIFDPGCKMYDCSDAEDCWEIDFISHDVFKRRYPKAEISDFSDEVQKVAPDWIKEKQVQIASWWKVIKDDIKLHLVDLGEGKAPVVMRSDELPANMGKAKILKSRDCEDRRIVQYVMNGVELLETNDPKDGKGWPGNWIPIIPFWGKEIFIDEGSGSKRILMSLIRLARDPQRYLNYLASQELMEAKLSPRTPYMGPKGMFSNQADQWAQVNDVPMAYIEYEMPEGSPPGLEPKRVPFVPNFQQYEMAKDAAKRSIMSAMGIAPLPTAAQRQNEKSGVALAKIAGERAQGSYHFIDNFDRSLEYCGRQLDDLFDRIHDTSREIPLRKEDGTHSLAKVNSPGDKLNKEFKGDHDVTITTGPSYESQREEAADFADTIAQIPGVFPLIGDLIVRLRRIGPIGEQIAERLTPPQFAQQDGEEPLPPAAAQRMSQMHQENQQLNAAAQALEAQIKQLQMEKSAKMWEADQRLQGIALQEQTKIIVAQASLARDNAETILQAELDKIQTILGQVHDHMMADHQAQIDKDQATHESSLTPPADSAQNSGDNG